MEKENDLIIGEVKPEDEEGVEIEILPASDYEYLMSAVNAFECVEGSNPITQDAQRRVNRIKRKSLAIIDYVIGVMYDELFDEEKKEEDD